MATVFHYQESNLYILCLLFFASLFLYMITIFRGRHLFVREEKQLRIFKRTKTGSKPRRLCKTGEEKLCFGNDKQISRVRNDVRGLPGTEAFRQLTKRVLLLNLMEVGEEGLDGGISLLEIVMGNSREQMMDDMRSNIVVKMLKGTIDPIDRFKIATNVVPIFCVVPFGARLGVM